MADNEHADLQRILGECKDHHHAGRMRGHERATVEKAIELMKKARGKGPSAALSSYLASFDAGADADESRRDHADAVLEEAKRLRKFGHLFHHKYEAIKGAIRHLLEARAAGKRKQGDTSLSYSRRDWSEAARGLGIADRSGGATALSMTERDRSIADWQQQQSPGLIRPRPAAQAELSMGSERRMSPSELADWQLSGTRYATRR